ncbi:hypothetical protein SERLA73DRAFT_185242, partial [Serpula lacrymans var. lacrymans S7.3]
MSLPQLPFLPLNTPQTPIQTPHSRPPSSSASTRSYSTRQTPEEKLDVIFNTIIKEMHWSFAEFMYYAFRIKDNDGNEIHRTKQHATIISRFLRGRDRHLPIDILAMWMEHPDG